MMAGFVTESKLESYRVSITGSWLMGMPGNGDLLEPYRRFTTSDGAPDNLAVDIVMAELSIRVSE
jgi:hypothetical protein